VLIKILAMNSYIAINQGAGTYCGLLILCYEWPIQLIVLIGVGTGK
jgi:hypothetical protein